MFVSASRLGLNDGQPCVTARVRIAMKCKFLNEKYEINLNKRKNIVFLKSVLRYSIHQILCLKQYCLLGCGADSKSLFPYRVSSQQHYCHFELDSPLLKWPVLCAAYYMFPRIRGFCPLVLTTINVFRH